MIFEHFDATWLAENDSNRVEANVCKAENGVVTEEAQVLCNNCWFISSAENRDKIGKITFSIFSPDAVTPRSQI